MGRGSIGTAGKLIPSASHPLSPSVAAISPNVAVSVSPMTAPPKPKKLPSFDVGNASGDVQQPFLEGLGVVRCPAINDGGRLLQRLDREYLESRCAAPFKRAPKIVGASAWWAP